MAPKPGTRNLEPGTWNPERRGRWPRALGVTLIEMIVVISITGIIGAAVAIFIRSPVEGYVDAARRAELTDIADTALRRMTRDLRRALPNSIRISTVGAATYLEYLQTTGGGRYRYDVTSTGGGDPLDFTALDMDFEVLGPMPANIVANNDLIVVYNLGPGSGTTDAYTGGNTSDVTAFDDTLPLPFSISITAKQFPFPSPGKRFQVISGPVTYLCDPVAQTVRRFSGYAVTASQPIDVSVPPLSAATVDALLATSVTACTFVYSAITQRAGSVALSLQIARDGESVRLFQQAHINNVP